jgi:hypothetical protein
MGIFRLPYQFEAQSEHPGAIEDLGIASLQRSRVQYDRLDGFNRSFGAILTRVAESEHTL